MSEEDQWQPSRILSHEQIEELGRIIGSVTPIDGRGLQVVAAHWLSVRNPTTRANEVVSFHADLIEFIEQLLAHLRPLLFDHFRLVSLSVGGTVERLRRELLTVRQLLENFEIEAFIAPPDPLGIRKAERQPLNLDGWNIGAMNNHAGSPRTARRQVPVRAASRIDSRELQILRRRYSVTGPIGDAKSVDEFRTTLMLTVDDLLVAFDTVDFDQSRMLSPSVGVAAKTLPLELQALRQTLESCPSEYFVGPPNPSNFWPVGPWSFHLDERGFLELSAKSSDALQTSDNENRMGRKDETWARHLLALLLREYQRLVMAANEGQLPPAFTKVPGKNADEATALRRPLYRFVRTFAEMVTLVGKHTEDEFQTPYFAQYVGARATSGLSLSIRAAIKILNAEKPSGPPGKGSAIR